MTDRELYIQETKAWLRGQEVRLEECCMQIKHNNESIAVLKKVNSLERLQASIIRKRINNTNKELNKPKAKGTQ